MHHEIICSWLKVLPDQWPPDHYTLLGLKPGESDLEVIEKHAQSRLEKVRNYQLTNPEPATEAMNRLAQAFVCLTDPQAKQRYDRSLFGEPDVPESPVIESSPEPVPEVLTPTAEEAATESEPVLWLNQALKAMEGASSPTLTPVSPSAVQLPTDEDLARTEETYSAALDVTEEAPPLSEQAQEHERQAASAELEGKEASRARRGLTTKRAFYFRLARIRAMLTLWNQVGKYMANPEGQLKRPAEAKEMIDLLTQVVEMLGQFPLPIGKAGKPGYLVVSLARQQVIVPTFQTLLPEQREALARDWHAGRNMLLSHKAFLRQELEGLRSRSRVGRIYRSIRAFLRAYPAGWLLVFGALALLIVLIRQIL